MLYTKYNLYRFWVYNPKMHKIFVMNTNDHECAEILYSQLEFMHASYYLYARDTEDLDWVLAKGAYPERMEEAKKKGAELTIGDMNEKALKEWKKRHQREGNL